MGKYSYSEWLLLFRCKDMTPEEKLKFLQRLWTHHKFGEKIYREYEDWLKKNEDYSWETENERIEDSLRKSKQRSIRYTGKYKGRGKFKGKV